VTPIPKRREHLPADLGAMHTLAETITCPRCGSEPGEPCINPHKPTPMHIPCLVRIRLGQEAAQ
jgi:hypothetical protein